MKPQSRGIMNKLIYIFAAAAVIGTFIIGFAGSNKKSAEQNYQDYCATCHGADYQGGLSKSLADGKWEFGNDDAEITKNIKYGIIEAGMPAFGEVLSDSEIDDLVSLLRTQEKDYTDPEYLVEDEVETFDYDVNVELVTEEVEEPWGIAFISSSKILVTEKPGALRIIENGKLLDDPVKGVPEVRYSGQGGMLDVAVDPNYDKNGWIYLSFSHDIDGKGMTKLVRGKLDGINWTDEEVIFEADPEFYIDSRHHFGCRIVFDDEGHLFFSIGDRGVREQAQDLSRPNGKIHRIFTDGRIPEDNPFVNDPDAFPTIFSYGNRNAQGLSINPETGELWASEHGQKGGDEINIIRSGKNYGWDKITYGRNYSGSVSTEHVKLPGMEVPVLFWRPSIAVCGIDFYKGDLFSKWDNHLIVGALKYEEVRLLDIEDDRVIHQEIVLKDAGRVRDVSVSPDGSIYVALNSPDKIVRLTPDN
jgi:glucose/arabinose dehydrogenase